MEVSREELFQLYDGLRVTDVNDGMDALGLQDVGCVDGKIKALWKDFERFSHRIYGFALTVRYLPTNRPQIRDESLDAYAQAKSNWYRTYASDQEWTSQIQKGDIVVIDGSGTHDTGYIGSNNGFAWITAGAHGIVTNGGCRDTDECIKQRMPVYSRGITRGIRPGRLEYGGCNIPVEIGGVMVRPGDFIVADGDGVLVIPIEKAVEVAKFARAVQDSDKETRRALYTKNHLEFDFTVQ